MGSEGHHIVPRQRIKQARSRMAIQRKLNRPMTPAEVRLLDTPLGRILDDRRNIIRLSRTRHHRAHGGFERLRRDQLPREIEDFAADFALEAALEHELRLIDQGERRL